MLISSALLKIVTAALTGRSSHVALTNPTLGLVKKGENEKDVKNIKQHLNLEQHWL